MRFEWKPLFVLLAIAGLALVATSCKPEQESAGDQPADDSGKTAFKYVPASGTFSGEDPCDVAELNLNGARDGGGASLGIVPPSFSDSNTRNFSIQNPEEGQAGAAMSGTSGDQQGALNGAVQSLRPSQRRGGRSGFPGRGSGEAGLLLNNGASPAVTVQGNNSPEATVPTSNGNSRQDNEVAVIGDDQTPVVEQPAEEDLSVNVWQYGYYWKDGLLMVNYTMELNDDLENIPPNGLVLCQEIPEGWEVVAADPRVEAVDEENRVVKWLFVGDGVKDQNIMTVSMRATDGSVDVWDKAMVWYTYRQADGTFAQVPAQLHPASEILPRTN